MCELSTKERVHILKDILLHPSSPNSERFNKEFVRAELMDAMQDLLDEGFVLCAQPVEK